MLDNATCSMLRFGRRIRRDEHTRQADGSRVGKRATPFITYCYADSVTTLSFVPMSISSSHHTGLLRQDRSLPALLAGGSCSPSGDLSFGVSGPSPSNTGDLQLEPTSGMCRSVLIIPMRIAGRSGRRRVALANTAVGPLWAVFDISDFDATA